MILTKLHKLVLFITFLGALHSTYNAVVAPLLHQANAVDQSKVTQLLDQAKALAPAKLLPQR